MNKDVLDVLEKDVLFFMKFKNHIEYVSICSRSVNGRFSLYYKVIIECKMKPNHVYGWRGNENEIWLNDGENETRKANKKHAALLWEIADYMRVDFIPEVKYRFETKLESASFLETISNVITRYAPSIKLLTTINKAGYHNKLDKIRKEHVSDLYMENNFKHYFEYGYGGLLNEHYTFSEYLKEIKRSMESAKGYWRMLNDSVNTIKKYENECKASYKKVIIAKIMAGTKLTPLEIEKYEGFVDAYAAYYNIMSYVKEGNKSIDEIAKFINK